MRPEPFSRPTLLAAIGLLSARLSQAGFNQLLVHLGVENAITMETTVSVAKKAALLAKEITLHPTRTVLTLDGEMTIGEAVVREAVKATSSVYSDQPQHAFLRGLGLDGHVVRWGDAGQPAELRAALPEISVLPRADDEVHDLLETFRFDTSLGHLDQAIDAHTRGDWAAANSQIRTFLESLLDEIARHIDPDRAATLPTSENRRALLAEVKFLSVERSEWTADGKNFVNGLFKMLHSEGSHPGLSVEDISTFRLQLALVTARVFLRRLSGWSTERS